MLFLALICVTCLVACGSKDTGSAQPSTTARKNSGAKAASQKQKTTAALPGKIKLKDGGDRTVFSLKFMDDGAKLVDGEEQELARYKMDPASGKVKVKSASDEVLGYVVAGQDQWKIKDAAQERELFKLQRQSDGDWKLEDGNDKLIYRIKRREYGFEVEDPQLKSLHKIKFKQGKISVRDAADKVRYETKSEVAAASVACLVLDAVPDVRIRGGLMYAVQDFLRQQ